MNNNKKNLKHSKLYLIDILINYTLFYKRTVPYPDQNQLLLRIPQKNHVINLPLQ